MSSETDEDLLKACLRYQITLNEGIKPFTYTSFPAIIQNGPQCGLVALAMYLKVNEIQFNDIFKLARSLNFTNNGEMFSVNDMCTLITKYTNGNVKCEVYTGDLFTHEIQSFLLNKGVMLVPYDSDANHEPCLKNGHKAHWALICGLIELNDIYVFARQGKSRLLEIWKLKNLADSNAQLNEVSPTRLNDLLDYVLPPLGIDSSGGLKNKSILIYP